MPTAVAKKARFGPFEVDLNTGEVSNNGTRIRLQPQPLEVLSILLERPGELVTREEFRKRLWADDTFVDFEHSLNTAIKKLRQALGDEAVTPRYIETLPRRGYRLLADLEVIKDECPAPPKPFESPKPTPSRKRSRKTLWLILLAAAIVVASLYSLTRSKVPYVKAVHQLTRTGNHKSAYGVRKVVTDGTRIYFAERIHGGWKLVQMSAQGGETSIVDTGSIQNPHVLDISRDGSELLVSGFGLAESWLWIVPLPAGTPRPVGKTQTYTARFTPDGTHVIFAGDNQLFIEEKDGSRLQHLLTAENEIRDFAISPDGKVIRLTAAGRIFEAGIDGSGLHRYLPQNAKWHCCGDWSPDGQFYTYSELKDDNSIHLFAKLERNPWTSKTPLVKPIQLSFGPIPFSFPTVSRDNKQVFAFGEVLKGELQFYDSTSGLLGPYLSGASIGNIDFSHDRQWITYVAFPEGTLWKSRVDGTERVQLTFPPTGQVSNPKWSPDGRLIVFEEWGLQSRKVYMIAATGGAPMLKMTDQFDPNWSPDGEFLVSSSVRGEESAVQLMKWSDGSITIVPGSKGLCFPRWSPDGKHLLALSYDLKKLMLYSFDEKKWRELYSSDEIGFPSFSHDNRFVYFSHGFAEKRGEIMRVRIADGHVERAADLRPTETTMPIFRLGGWFALTPDDQILVLRDRGSDELYSLDICYR